MRDHNARENDWIELHTAADPARGNLYIGEAEKHIPFKMRRFYVTTDVPPNGARGAHAHKMGEQAVFCIRGSCKVSCDDGKTQWSVLLHDPSKGYCIKKRVWHTMSDFSSDAVLLTLADDWYDESDYLRDYKEFLTFITAL